MAAIAPITIADGKGTPESHVFNPIATLPLALLKRNTVSGQATVAWEQLTVNVKSAGNTGMNTVTVELSVPVMEQSTGGTSSGYVAPPSVAHRLTAKVVFFMHNRSTAADRKDLRVLIQNALANSQVVSAIEALEQPY